MIHLLQVSGTMEDSAAVDVVANGGVLSWLWTIWEAKSLGINSSRELSTVCQDTALLK